MAAKLALDPLWAEIEKTAARAGLDPAKFGAVHRRVAAMMAAFLGDEPIDQVIDSAGGGWPSWIQSLLPQSGRETVSMSPAQISPIIVCGRPGTGKTTFLYVLDAVFRRRFELPDLVTPRMAGSDGRIHPVAKRSFLGRPISLLSVRQWSELLHFYAWDIDNHRFNLEAQERFIDHFLQPMKLILADEVEITGYSPTLPTLANHGLLVVGTSNQTTFTQLESEEIPARIFHFDGVDMRVGDPADAVVTAGDPALALFAFAAGAPVDHHGILPFQAREIEGVALIMIDFNTALQAPFLESQWIDFIQAAYVAVVGEPAALEPDSRAVLLLENFTLEALRTNFNGIMRFVSLFDVVEQLCLGTLVGQPDGNPGLSREALAHMKVTVHATHGVSDEVKKKTVVGVDRAASRIGQAGFRAREITDVR